MPTCIQCMLDQNSNNWCCVFVDGYSDDGSWEFMQQFDSDPRFLLLRGHRQGMYVDWNECLKHVDTDYFYFLTSDDTCSPELVSSTTSLLDTYTDIDVCHFQFSKIDSQGKILRTYDQILRKQFPLYVDTMHYPHRRSGTTELVMHSVYRSLYITITSLVFRRRLIKKLGGFTNQYGSSGDFDWTMRMGLFTDILYIPKHLATWRRTYKDQATQNTRSYEVLERNLGIARKNLSDAVMHEKFVENFIKPPEIEEITSHLSYEYLLSLYRAGIESRDLFNSLKYLCSLTKRHTRIFFEDLVRASLRPKSDFIFASRTEFAKYLTNEYKLEWPPMKIGCIDEFGS